MRRTCPRPAAFSAAASNHAPLPVHGTRHAITTPGAVIRGLPRFAASSGPQVTVVGSATKVRPGDRPAGRPEARLIAARNEFESFQIVCQAGDSQPMGELTISLKEPLRGAANEEIAADYVTIYREDYYDVKAPSNLEGETGPWPDVLIPVVDPFLNEPRKAFPIDVPAGENRLAWIDVLVPIDAEPGDYRGSLTVTWDDDSTDIPVHLTVIDATLPSTASLKSAFGLTSHGPCEAAWGEDCANLNDEAGGWILNSLYAFAALHNRITVSTPHYDHLRPDNVHLFREYVLPMLNGTAPTALPGAQLTSFQVGPSTSLTMWKAEAEEQGFADRAFLYACDEPGSDPDIWGTCLIDINEARSTWPDLATLVTASLRDTSDAGAVELVNRLVVLVNEMEDKPTSPFQDVLPGNQRASYAPYEEMNPDNEVWLYASCMSHGCGSGAVQPGMCRTGLEPDAGPITTDPYYTGWPGYTIDAPASQARAMGWLAYLYDARGELYYRVDQCLPSARTAQYAFGGNGDGTLFYHGHPDWIGGVSQVPVESIRLKLIRDGYEDFEYLRILEEMGKGEEARQIAENLFPTMYSASRTQEEIDAARTALARLIDPARVP